MKKTFVTIVPNHIGAFLKASGVLRDLGINMTRVSYNKAVDSHMLFIDAEGAEDQLEEATRRLTEVGYIQCSEDSKEVVLLEFRLEDKPGSVFPILELINSFNFNISFLSSQENGSGVQYFKMGLVSDAPEKIRLFLDEARKLCPVKKIDYNHADKVFDNSLFYKNFVNELIEAMDLPLASKEEILVNTNLAMQQLDETGVSPYRTFDSISRFAELLSASRGERFQPRITRLGITPETEVILIEPPCGSNTAILKSKGEYLFVDSGYACYRNEMLQLFRTLVPDFGEKEKRLFITHADVDHCGLMDEFDVVYGSERSIECLTLEAKGEDGYRERNRLHKPYIRICKVLTSYPKVDPSRTVVVGGTYGDEDEVLAHTGSFSFGELKFQVYEGKGGHLKGESVLIDYAHRLVFSGDVYVNMKDMTPEQKEYNRYAPILMTSVDTNVELCARERSALFDRLGIGEWRIFGGHGAMKSHKVQLSRE